MIQADDDTNKTAPPPWNGVDDYFQCLAFSSITLRAFL